MVGIRLRTAALALALALLAGAANAQPLRCPPGTMPWFDTWQNPTCRSIDSGQDVLIAPNPRTGLPNGTLPGGDGWGNRTARGQDGSTFYPAQRGCPAGFQPWRDPYGIPTCRPM